MASPEREPRAPRRGATGSGSSFMRGAATRVAPSTSSRRHGDGDSDFSDFSDGDARSAISSVLSSREPTRRQAWTPADGSGPREVLDEWDYAERGPVAKLQARREMEVAREKAALGVYVDDASDGVPSHLRPLSADPDFTGPESYPRRSRDWMGYHFVFGACFASLVLGVAGVGFGNPAYLFRPVESNSGRLCGSDPEVKHAPFAYHPYAGNLEFGRGAERSQCVEACPTADAWVCVDADAAAAASDASSSAASSSAASSSAPAPFPSPPPTPPSAACASGVYVRSLVDFEPVFGACVPRETAGATDPPAVRSSREKHLETVLREVDTSERFVSFAIFAELESQRWCVFVALLLAFGAAFGLSAVAHRDAERYHRAALAGSVVCSAFVACLFGLARFLGIGILRGIFMDGFDARFATGSVVTRATPYVAFPFLWLAFRVATLAIRRKNQIGLGTTLMDVAGFASRSAGLDVAVPLGAIVPIAAIAAWAAIGTVYLSAAASEHFQAERVRGRVSVSVSVSIWAYRAATAIHASLCGWFALWVILCARCVVSTVVLSWYWAREGDRERKVAEMSTWRAFRRVARYHAGSLAVLAFWIPALTIPRWAVTLHCRARGWTGSKTPPYSAALAYRSAAVCQIALHGCALKRACFNQHHLKIRNADVVEKCAVAGSEARFAGLVFTSLVGFSAAAALGRVDFLVYRPVIWTLAPATFAGIFGMVLFAACFAAHAEAVETAAQCFCEDAERNDGTATRRYYAPEALKTLLLAGARGLREPSARDADEAFAGEVREQKKRRRRERRERRDAGLGSGGDGTTR